MIFIFRLFFTCSLFSYVSCESVPVLPTGTDNGAHLERSKDLACELDSWNRALRQSRKRIYKKKMKKMAHSFFSFYRGTDHLFAFDYLTERGIQTRSFKGLYRYAGLSWNTVLQGDMHFNNVGLSHVAVGGKQRPVFAVNDFDEMTIGNVQLDLWRLLTSFYLEESWSDKDANLLSKTMLKYYFQILKGVHSGKVQLSSLGLMLPKRNQKTIARYYLKAIQDKSSKAFKKDDPAYAPFFSIGENDELKWKKSKKIGEISKKLEKKIINKIVTSFRHLNFTVLGVAVRLGAGLGSLGRHRYYAVIKKSEQYFLLDIKSEDKKSTFMKRASDRYQKNILQEWYTLKGRGRVLEGYDSYFKDKQQFTASFSLSGKSYVVFERSPYKLSLVDAIHVIKTKSDKKELAELLGTVLAIHHARSSLVLKEKLYKDKNYDFIANMGRVSVSDFILYALKITKSYAHQVRQDFEIFKSICFKGHKVRKQGCGCN